MHSFAYIIIRFAFQQDMHAIYQERAETLTGRPMQANLDAVIG